MYELGWHTKGIIGVTQPRRVAAMTVAERVSNERGEVLGGTVGVSVSFIDRVSDDTHIKVCTQKTKCQLNSEYIQYSTLKIVFMFCSVHDRRDFVA